MQTGMAMATALLLACATGAGAQTADPEERALLEEMFRCVDARAVELDDAKSDAATIARGAVSVCSTTRTRAASYGAYIRGLPATELNIILERRATDQAIATLLAARAKRSKPARPAAPPKPKGTAI